MLVRPAAPPYQRRVAQVSKDQREQQKRANAAFLEALRERGDSLTRVRDIDHWATFPSAAARASFVENCLAAGMKLRGTADPQRPDESYSARVFHRDIPDEDCINLVTILLIGLASAAGGEYDGWETQLVQRGSH
jgi:Regulator of ribonuclease activity B